MRRGCGLSHVAVRVRQEAPLVGATAAPTTTAGRRAGGGGSTTRRRNRLWRGEGLRVPQRHRRKHIGFSTAGEQVTAQAPDDVWGIDFQFDRVEDGQALKACSVDDEHTRESLGGLTGTSVTGERVIALTDLIAAVRGYPLVLRSDSGPESVCDAIADWAKGRIALAFIPPGTPWNNGYVESFHARPRPKIVPLSHRNVCASARNISATLKLTQADRAWPAAREHVGGW